MRDNSLETGDAHLLLLGHPPASDFLRMVRTRSPDAERPDAAELVSFWRAARAHVRELEKHDEPIEPDVCDIPVDMAEAARNCFDDPVLHEIRRISPCRWLLVELDRLIVLQKYVNLRRIMDIENLLAGQRSARDLIRLASGHTLHRPGVQIVRTDEGAYVLSCDSSELRLLGSRVLDPSVLAHERLTGTVTHVIGLLVGFGASCISAIRFRKRVILTNGTHRAFALRRTGLTHVPCLVTDIDHDDDLDLIGVADSRARIERNLRLPRPPLLKDFFDPSLTRQQVLMRTRRVLQLEITPTFLRVP
jgi:hypothetical protein